jgi:hypothetical protein
MTSNFGIRAARILVVGGSVVAVASIVIASLNRSPYSYYRSQDRTKWEYPLMSVAMLVGAAAMSRRLLKIACSGSDSS